MRLSYTGELQLLRGSIDAAAFDLRRVMGLCWRQLVQDKNVRPDLGTAVPAMQLLCDAMKIDGDNMLSRLAVR